MAFFNPEEAKPVQPEKPEDPGEGLDPELAALLRNLAQ